LSIHDSNMMFALIPATQVAEVNFTVNDKSLTADSMIRRPLAVAN
jgi:hypothetical protein